MNENNDEIIIGINVPNSSKSKEKKSKKKTKGKKKINKEVAKKATSKEKKTKARIVGNSRIFRNRLIKKLVIIFILIIAIILFLASSIFYIKEIDVQNNEMVSNDEIISLLQLGENRNIFSFSTKKIKQKIKENSYIEDVVVKRSLPNKLVLNVKERKVKYMISLGEAYIYLNNQGYILDKSSEKKDVPILLGIITDVSELNIGNRLNVKDLTKIDTVNRICESANNNGVLPLISKIDISDSKNYTLYLESEKKTVYLGTGSNLNTRLLFVNAIIEQEQGIEGEIFVNVDLNNDNVYFREKI